MSLVPVISPSHQFGTQVCSQYDAQNDPMRDRVLRPAHPNPAIFPAALGAETRTLSDLDPIRQADGRGKRPPRCHCATNLPPLSWCCSAWLCRRTVCLLSGNSSFSSPVGFIPSRFYPHDPRHFLHQRFALLLLLASNAKSSSSHPDLLARCARPAAEEFANRAGPRGGTTPSSANRFAALRRQRPGIPCWDQ
jgi:hypothetical protein